MNPIGGQTVSSLQPRGARRRSARLLAEIVTDKSTPARRLARPGKKPIPPRPRVFRATSFLKIEFKPRHIAIEGVTAGREVPR